MDENFSIYIPPQVESDPTSLALYKEYELYCKDMYGIIRMEMNKKEISGEKANDLMRTMLPIGVGCNLTMGFTIEAIMNFMHKRLCVRADEPIRQVAKLMRKAILDVEPRYSDLLVPQCVDKMYCPEKHSCGAYLSKAEVQKKIFGK